METSEEEGFEQDADEPDDAWEDFRGDDLEPIGLGELATLEIPGMPEDVRVWVLDDYFPDTTITRRGDTLVCHIEEHIYTKFWEHKFSGYAFANAMERAVRRLAQEGHPLANPTCDDSDVHIFVRWDLMLPVATPPARIADSIKAAFDLVWQRADAILQDSDSVLILGKDTGPGLDLLLRIAAKLQDLGYHTYIIKEQPDRPGEGVIQKVLRYALSSKFVVIENTEASGHLYEVPHVAKSAECVTVVLQEEGRGATWMFEDGYAKHKHWHKETYVPASLEAAVERGARWAETFIRDYAAFQVATLPWITS